MPSTTTVTGLSRLESSSSAVRKGRSSSTTRGSAATAQPSGVSRSAGSRMGGLALHGVADEPAEVGLVEVILQLGLGHVGQPCGHLPQARAPEVVVVAEVEGGPRLDHVREGRFAPADVVRVT
ncbi:hypothetical protein GCM10020001_028930 [Nonomuraea salmonea]